MVENTSSITEENLKNTMNLMEEMGFTSCILVSNPLHMMRVLQIAEDLGMGALASPTPTTRYQSWKTQIPFLARETVLYLGYCVLRPFR